MKLRVFAVAWTVFTALAAPALLLASEEPGPVPPPVDPAAPAPPVSQPPTDPVVTPAQPPSQPDAGSEPAQEAAAPPPAPEPDVDASAKTPAKRKPVARAAASTTVTIKDFEFTPKTITVNVGDTVTWSNAGPTGHSATGDGFDTGILQKGESGSHTFSSAGNFAYICTPHPFMKATVNVAAASSGSGGGSAGGESAAAADADDGPTLPNTGVDAWALALLGTGLLSLGLAVRRRSDSA